jgi:hypothetical protein
MSKKNEKKAVEVTHEVMDRVLDRFNNSTWSYRLKEGCEPSDRLLGLLEEVVVAINEKEFTHYHVMNTCHDLYFDDSERDEQGRLVFGSVRLCIDCDAEAQRIIKDKGMVNFLVDKCMDTLSIDFFRELIYGDDDKPSCGEEDKDFVLENVYFELL